MESDLTSAREDCQISYLAVGRDALRFARRIERAADRSVSRRRPRLRSRRGASSRASNERNCRRPSARASVARDTNRRFRASGATAGDASGRGRIASMLGVKPLLGAEALEARIKAGRSPRILHLARRTTLITCRSAARSEPGIARSWPARRASRRWFWPNVRDAVGEDVGAWDGEPVAAFGGRLWPDSRPGSKAGACRRRLKMGC